MKKQFCCEIQIIFLRPSFSLALFTLRSRGSVCYRKGAGPGRGLSWFNRVLKCEVRAGEEMTPSVLSVPLPLPHLLCLSLVQLQPLLQRLRLQHGTEHMSQSMTTERRSASHRVRHRERKNTLVAQESEWGWGCLRCFMFETARHNLSCKMVLF